MKIDMQGLSTKYHVRRLTPDDVNMIYDLSAGNPLFYRFCPPCVTKEGILADMEALPPHCSKEDKYYIGFFDGTLLIAIMDLIIGYPQTGTAYIGLFMTDQKVQGRGIGSELIRECLCYLKSMEIRTVQLAFAKGNPQSEAFWKKNQFQPTGKETNHGKYFSVSMIRKLD